MANYLVAILCLIIASSIKIRAEEPRGIDAKEGEFPYHAMFYDRFSNGPSSGGAILNEWYVLGSANNLQQFIPKLDKLAVYIGVTRIGSAEQKLEVAEIKIPDEYDVSKNQQHNIALVRTKEKIQYTIKAMPIKLPSSADDFTGELFSTSFGIRYYPQHFMETRGRSDILHYHKTSVIPMDKCKQMYAKDKYYNSNGDNLGSCFICTKNVEQFEWLYGDYGNPLVANGVLYGLAAWTGVGEKYPNVYTKVYCYKKWIQENSIEPKGQ